MIRCTIWLALVLVGCAGNPGRWQFDEVKSIELVMGESLPIGKYALYPCSDSQATGSFSVNYKNGDVERHSFCHDNARNRSWALLKILSASRQICFYKEIEIESDTVIRTTGPYDCYSSPHQSPILPITQD